MSEGKFTPGPFRSFNGTIFAGRGASAQAVATIPVHNPNAAGDTFLLTAAPELLEVLQWVESTGMLEHGGGGDMIRAAIAKALGNA